jgi:hypothetical protein
MRRLLSALVLVAAVGVASTGAAATPTAGRALLTYAVLPASGPYGGLCATDLRGHNYRISDPHDNGGQAWSPDGRSIAFTRRDNPGQDRFGLVFVTDAAGRHPLDITHGGARGAIYVVAWSPDGSQLILFWTGWGPYGGSYIVNADGSGGFGLGDEGIRISGGSWSPQGRILFEVWSPSGVPAVYVTESDGAHRVKLIDSAAGAVWSPDGRQFAYVAYRDGKPAGLGVAEADGSGTHLLVEGRIGRVAWSPDGRQLAYFGSLDANSVPHTLEVVQADGTGARLLAQGDLLQAAWSPDGSMIAFTRGIPLGSRRLFLIRPDGTGEHIAPTGGLPASDPAWRRPASLPDPRPCIVRGTPRADVIRGTDRGDLIYGGAGNDRIYGNGGDDALVGGGGHERLHGGRGNDYLFARDGVRDFLFGGPGHDSGALDPVDVVRSIEQRNY